MHQISKIDFVIKLYMFRASSVPIIRSRLLYTRQSVRFVLRSNLTLLGSGHLTCMKRANCRVYSRRLLMMGTEDARNM